MFVGDWNYKGLVDKAQYDLSLAYTLRPTKCIRRTIRLSNVVVDACRAQLGLLQDNRVGRETGHTLPSMNRVAPLHSRSADYLTRPVHVAARARNWMTQRRTTTSSTYGLQTTATTSSTHGLQTAVTTSRTDMIPTAPGIVVVAWALLAAGALKGLARLRAPVPAPASNGALRKIGITAGVAAAAGGLIAIGVNAAKAKSKEIASGKYEEIRNHQLGSKSCPQLR
ncbi:unnamed protein product (mitochondrion) [Plasmodiophora brassicae]|uniref:Uncharacterized protein n=1 Tax=Plasmodiophora brassicae TaxID=37360 RepID=A0A3P3YGX8_PLABS|nr:unnamed protein product [Plasmodiophora brassicae]